MKAIHKVRENFCSLLISLIKIVFISSISILKVVLVQIPWEIDAETELKVQEVYW